MSLKEEKDRLLLETQCQFVNDKFDEMEHLVKSQEENFPFEESNESSF